VREEGNIFPASAFFFKVHPEMLTTRTGRNVNCFSETTQISDGMGKKFKDRESSM